MMSLTKSSVAAISVGWTFKFLTVMSSYITPYSVNFCLMCFDALLFGKYSFKTWHTGAGAMTQWLKESRFGSLVCSSPRWLQVFLGI